MVPGGMLFGAWMIWRLLHPRWVLQFANPNRYSTCTHPGNIHGRRGDIIGCENDLAPLATPFGIAICKPLPVFNLNTHSQHSWSQVGYYLVRNRLGVSRRPVGYCNLRTRTGIQFARARATFMLEVASLAIPVGIANPDRNWIHTQLGIIHVLFRATSLKPLYFL